MYNGTTSFTAFIRRVMIVLEIFIEDNGFFGD